MATTTAVPTTRITGGSFLLEERRTEEVFTPEDFPEQQRMIGQTTEEFAINEIVPNVEKMEHKDFSVSRDLLKKAGELGLTGVEIPEAYGGPEMDKVTAAVMADHLAKYAGFGATRAAPPGGGRTALRGCCRSFTSAPKTKRKNICRAWPLARWWEPTPCRNRPP